ncbi:MULTISPECIES: hypothetical protein [Mycolicibacter]|nr:MULTISPECIES: hypothetical protein [Mycolicibacter]
MTATVSMGGVRVMWVGAAAERMDQRTPWWRQALTPSSTNSPLPAPKLRSSALQAPTIGDKVDEVVTDPASRATSLGVDVTWPGEEPSRLEFRGTDNGPVWMFSAGLGWVIDTYVTWPNLFGALSPEWVRRFFGYGTWTAHEIVAIRQVTPNVVMCLANGFDIANRHGEIHPEWIGFARVSDTSVALLQGNFDEKDTAAALMQGHFGETDELRPRRGDLYGLIATYDLRRFAPEFGVQWVRNFLGDTRGVQE